MRRTPLSAQCDTGDNMSELKYRWRAIRRSHGFENKLYTILGGWWGGNVQPPGDHLTKRVEEDDGVERVFSYSEDGFELWFGYPDKWKFHMTAASARKLFWLIVKYELLTWFGLRRKVWYWLLRRKVERTRATRTVDVVEEML